MSQYLVLSYISIQNANSIAGLTWGFPAITQFLGFTHALNRKLSNTHDGTYALELSGCAVISHTSQNKVYKPKEFADFEFLQSKNPPVLAKHKNASPPIIEEGKMNLMVSLVVELQAPLNLTTDQIITFENEVLDLCSQMRIAGGNVLNIEQVKLLSASMEVQKQQLLRQVKRLVMPGFVLLDRSQYLKDRYQQLLSEYDEKTANQEKPQLLDAWLDFSALKYKAVPQLADNQAETDENTPADWQYVPKPKSGYLVPLMTGYKAISELYEPETVLNTRYNPTDESTTKTCFVEAVHSVGEWKGVHSMKNISDTIWRYQQDGQWYLCQQTSAPHKEQESDLSDKSNQNSEQTLAMNEALNKFF